MTLKSVRTFFLWRTEDPSGVSGVGKVAEGAVFSDGTAVLRWCGERPSIVVHADLQALLFCHGHGGKTVVVFDDEEPAASVEPKGAD